MTLVDLYSMCLIIIVITSQQPDTATLYLIYSLWQASEVCVMTSILWRKNRDTKKIINNDSNNYLCLPFTITVLRSFHMWTHSNLTSTFWRRFCFISLSSRFTAEASSDLIIYSWHMVGSGETAFKNLSNPITESIPSHCTFWLKICTRSHNS